MHEISPLKLKVLSELGGIVGRALRLERALYEVLSVLGSHLSMKHGTISLLNRERTAVVSCVSHNHSMRDQSKGMCRLPDSEIVKTALKGQPFVVMEGNAAPVTLDGAVARRLVRQKVAMLGVPVMEHGREAGLVAVDRLFESPVSIDADMEFLSMIAAFVGQLVCLNNAVAERMDELKRENVALRYRVSGETRKGYVVARSASMSEVECQMEQVAASDEPVLIVGEAGVGKAMLAALIHDISERSRHPFVRVDCQAVWQSQGNAAWGKSPLAGGDAFAVHFAERVEASHGGTLCVEHMEFLPPAVQALLLRVLQGQELERAGCNLVRRVDVRVIALSDSDIVQDVRMGRVSPELYGMLAGSQIHVPPLRERKEDLSALLNHLIAKVDREYGRHLSFGADALEVLQRYDWPGNVSEVEMVVERLASMTDGERIGAASLMSLLGGEGAGTGRKGGATGAASLKDMERKEVLSALRRTGWVQYRAAEELGLTPRQMGYRIRKFGLENMVASERARVR
ncbi:sigma 54-interacting transcriptional regulator [Desulfovibrio mangrovi]|uniref:sigma 54-interacting transcriptional regulator n=1 Tax=Desulfovibrio mangrovi TaxID=2976983 RepID=UPI002247DD76|nr:sigma 54-interacting transcriptional regulator [Desulfovibrio mangrovi]UZP67882.1 sigma 54-interacting transcriptional regulator [Desulfovibrio mangrovi]